MPDESAETVLVPPSRPNTVVGCVMLNEHDGAAGVSFLLHAAAINSPRQVSATSGVRRPTTMWSSLVGRIHRFIGDARVAELAPDKESDKGEAGQMLLGECPGDEVS